MAKGDMVAEEREVSTDVEYIVEVTLILSHKVAFAPEAPMSELNRLKREAVDATQKKVRDAVAGKLQPMPRSVASVVEIRLVPRV